MEHLLRAGSRLLTGTVHLSASSPLCGPRKALARTKCLPLLLLMIPIQMIVACYDIPPCSRAGVAKERQNNFY